MLIFTTHFQLQPQGMDISPAMLGVALEREVEGDLCLQDLGQGLPIRPGTFDGAISISAVQWLCNAVCGAGWRGLSTVAPNRGQGCYFMVLMLLSCKHAYICACHAL